jgi:AhpD family alkylhydroperoxidase
MSAFDSVDLMKSINDNLGPFRKSQTETMLGFGQMAKGAMAEGTVSAKHKELIAVAIGITQHCGGCIAFHVKALHRLGCTRAEFEEAMGVCVYMGGGPGLMNVAEALAAWDATAPAVTN